MEIALVVITVIMLYASYEIIVYNKIKKENERNNKERCCDSKKKKYKPKRNKKVSKVKTQNKRKHRGSKEEIEE